MNTTRDEKISSRNLIQRGSINKINSNSLQQTSTVDLPARHQLNHSVELTKNELDYLQNEGQGYGAYINSTTRDGSK